MEKTMHAIQITASSCLPPRTRITWHQTNEPISGTSPHAPSTTSGNSSPTATGIKWNSFYTTFSVLKLLCLFCVHGYDKETKKQIPSLHVTFFFRNGIACFSNSLHVPLPSSTVPPGQLYSPDDQCKLIWGPRSYLCRVNLFLFHI